MTTSNKITGWTVYETIEYRPNTRQRMAERIRRQHNQNSNTQQMCEFLLDQFGTNSFYTEVVQLILEEHYPQHLHTYRQLLLLQ